jgi:ubiquinone/menaquinone biosynthesis C-methylase UbiE
MQEQKEIIDCYDKTALNYADKFGNELVHKHLDRILLQAFASENAAKGKSVDIGCGPGQTTKFLADCGMTDIIGVDISCEMVNVAKKINPHLDFAVADMLNLPYADHFFASAIAFYSIVHFDYEQLETAFKEVKRVLSDQGQFLFSFHIGEDIIHLDKFLDHQVNIDFYLFATNRVTDLLTQTGFAIMDVIERHHYPEVEYASKRAYIWAKNNQPL